mmetsp:Transcript_14400/g.42369  ORF Transcript_14400/g.42369 Transcript_14400/m.42369 type:complete len:348 (-) Transcript_14400:43-1086(-)
MRLHARRVLGLREDLEHLVVGQKKEAREVEALHLEVLVEALLNELKQAPLLRARVQQARQLRDRQDVGVGADLGHVLAPHGVLLLKEGTLLRHLPHDVLRAKDWLEVLPHALHLDPDVDQVLDERELRGPPLGALLERPDEGRAKHRLRLDEVVVEQQLDLVDAADDVRPRIAVLHHGELERLPIHKHLVERLLERELLGGGGGNLVELLAPRLQVRRQDGGEARCRGRTEGLTHHLRHALPVAVAHPLIAQARDEWHLLLEGVDAALELLGRRQRRRGHALLREGLDRLEVVLPERLDLAVHHLRIDFLHRPVEPLGGGRLEGDARAPQLLVRRDEGGHLGQLREV